MWMNVLFSTCDIKGDMTKRQDFAPQNHELMLCGHTNTHVCLNLSSFMSQRPS